MKRYVFYISDSTGLTAEGLGNALLAQFKTIEISRVFLPYTNTQEKARQALLRIRSSGQLGDARPIIIATILDPGIREIIAESDGYVIDVFGDFLPGIEEELGEKSQSKVGGTHVDPADKKALRRIDAVNYALENDDGARINHYDRANLILVGVSRSAKTPTCLYMAMQFGIFAANYPLTEEDLELGKLPSKLMPFRDRLMALTIAPERLSEIRNERRSDSKYASLKQCQWEVREAALIYQKNGLKVIDTTSLSVEEIATQVLVATGVQRSI
ncbi:MAG: pyruvate, water dikinase regulatory protein [Porticoccaceae bacterium]